MVTAETPEHEAEDDEDDEDTEGDEGVEECELPAGFWRGGGVCHFGGGGEGDEDFWSG